jgi:hypothetical protein
MRLIEACDQVGQCAVIDATALLSGGDRQPDGEMRLADTGRSKEDEVFFRSTKPSVARFSICSRFREGWKLKSIRIVYSLREAGCSASPPGVDGCCEG